MKMMIDVDNTICIHTNRDYVNAAPIQPVIDKVNALYDRGVDICLYTSRGQNSCKGDLALIIERNEAVLVDWLKRHGVKYNELIFGKPLADFYVDDGGMSVKEFLQSDFQQFCGNSNSSILRLGDCVIKDTHNAQFQFDWYRRFEQLGIKGASVPADRLLTLSRLKMEYVQGKLFCNWFSVARLAELVSVVEQFSRIDEGENCNFELYLQNCHECYDEPLYRETISVLREYASYANDNVSFCHGDLALDNVIVSAGDDKLVLIDPNEKEWSSWLLDIAKMRCSFDGLEAVFGHVGWNKEYFCGRERFDHIVKSCFQCDMKFVHLLEITRFARILPYMRKMGKKQEQEAIERIIGGLCNEVMWL